MYTHIKLVIKGYSQKPNIYPYGFQGHEEDKLINELDLF